MSLKNQVKRTLTIPELREVVLNVLAQHRDITWVVDEAKDFLDRKNAKRKADGIVDAIDERLNQDVDKLNAKSVAAVVKKNGGGK